MNKYHVKYLLEDTKLGLKRNLGSTIASISLLFIALILIGFVMLTRVFVDDTLQYVESQLAMKVYVEDGLAEEIAIILEKQSYADDVEIESGDAMLEQLAFFFEGKEHLLQAFTKGSLPDAVKFQVTDKVYMQSIAEQLQDIDGILQVVYPQKMAEFLFQWSKTIELYGIIAIIVFLGLAFLMVSLTCHLAMYQRQKELKVKLLLGMNPKLVRVQFMLEGLVLGLIGAIASLVVIFIMYKAVFQRIQQEIPYIGQITLADVCIILTVQLLLGIVLSVIASYISTRKMIANV